MASAPPLEGGGERLYGIPGRIPDPDEVIAGCRFSPRYAYVEAICRVAPPELVSVDDARESKLMSAAALVEVRNVDMAFDVGRHKGKPARLQVLRDLSLDIASAETLGLVGESGSGKSTAARVVVGLHEPTAGTVKLFGRLITGPGRNVNLAAVRSRTQFVFQDPQAALDPRMRVGDSVAEPIDVAGSHARRDRNVRVQELLTMVGLPRDAADRFPHEFSGG